MKFFLNVRSASDCDLDGLLERRLPGLLTGRLDLRGGFIWANVLTGLKLRILPGVPFDGLREDLTLLIWMVSPPASTLGLRDARRSFAGLFERAIVALSFEVVRVGERAGRPTFRVGLFEAERDGLEVLRIGLFEAERAGLLPLRVGPLGTERDAVLVFRVGLFEVERV